MVQTRLSMSFKSTSMLHLIHAFSDTDNDGRKEVVGIGIRTLL
jgi:hypothetical protein